MHKRLTRREDSKWNFAVVQKGEYKYGVVSPRFVDCVRSESEGEISKVRVAMICGGPLQPNTFNDGRVADFQL